MWPGKTAACVSWIGSGRGAAVDQWGPLVTRAPAVSAGTSRLMWGSKTVGSGEWYLTVQSADPLRTVEYHSPLPTPLRCQVPLSTPHAAASLRLLQRRRDDPRLLGGVRRGVPLSGTRALGSADVAHRDIRSHELAQLRFHELLGPHVAWLLLHPDDLRDLGIALDQLGDLAGGERIQQLHPADRHVLGLRAPWRQQQVVIHLAAAQHEPRRGAPHVALGIVEHRLEAARRHAFEPGR